MRDVRFSVLHVALNFVVCDSEQTGNILFGELSLGCTRTCLHDGNVGSKQSIITCRYVYSKWIFVCTIITSSYEHNFRYWFMQYNEANLHLYICNIPRFLCLMSENGSHI